MQTPLTEPPSQAFNHFGLGGVGLEGVEVLAGLGLTGRQARVYLALLKVGVVRARVVASMAGVPRQEVYGLLFELQQMGLVRQNLTVPVSYVALPIAEAVALLLEQKTNELVLVTQRAKRLTTRLSQARLVSLVEASKPCFGEVCEGERGKRYQTAIEQAQHSIDALLSWARFKQLCFHFENQLIDALKKGVEIRLIAEKPANHNLPRWVNPTGKKYANFQLKLLSTPPEAAVMIFDGAKLALAFNPYLRLTKGPDLWTRHPALLASYPAFFESVWAKTENHPLP